MQPVVIAVAITGSVPRKKDNPAVPVTPAAHYWMGGVRTDLWGRTSVPGLFAVGEVACTGVHGANRLASNSLLESLVFAWRAAQWILGEAPAGEGDMPRPGQGEPDAAEIAIDVAALTNATTVERPELQTMMWSRVGIQRDGKHLAEAAAQLAGWSSAGADPAHRETENLLAIARVMVAAALARRESRGAHFREDFPEREAAFEQSLLYVKSEPARDSAVALPGSEVAVPC